MRSLTLVLTLSLLPWFAAPVTAERIPLGRLPANPQKLGLVMTAETDAVGGNGYQPVYVTFMPFGKTFVRDRYLEVAISPRNDWQTDLDFEFRQPIVVPQGAASHTAVLYVPHYYPWDWVSLTLREDGRQIENGSIRSHQGSLRARSAEQRITVGIMEPHDSSVQDAAWKVFPDVRSMLTVLGDGPLPEDSDVPRLSHKQAVDLAGQVQRGWVQFRQLQPANLHQQWLGYSQLDVMLIAAPTLDRIRSEQPESYGQIEKWVVAGGKLWVYANQLTDAPLVDQPLNALQQKQLIAPEHVTRTLRLSQPNDTSELVHQSWNGVQRQSDQYGFQSNSLYSDRRDVYDKLVKAENPIVASVATSELAPQLGYQSFGLGSIVTMKSLDPFPGSLQLWRSILNLHPPASVPWIERNGIDVINGNEYYWGWLIGAVGQPPVKSFVFLNTVFVILIGPVCYFFFRRRQRLYLLYFFAPALALLVTTSLFAYALVSDGVQAKVRTSQLTWVDIENDALASQSRQTYYAVLGSRDGITQPADAAIYPVVSLPLLQRYSGGYSESGRHGQYLATPEHQVLLGSFLPPRNQVQYLIQRPETRTASLRFDFDSDAPTVVNQLDYPLTQLLLRDKQGRYFHASDLAPGQRLHLQPASAAMLRQMLGRQPLPNRADVPQLTRSYRSGRTPGMHLSQLESRLDQWQTQMPTGAFVATAPVQADYLGIEDPLVLDSIHVLLGELP